MIHSSLTRPCSFAPRSAFRRSDSPSRVRFLTESRFQKQPTILYTVAGCIGIVYIQASRRLRWFLGDASHIESRISHVCVLGSAFASANLGFFSPAVCLPLSCSARKRSACKRDSLLTPPPGLSKTINRECNP